MVDFYEKQKPKKKNKEDKPKTKKKDIGVEITNKKLPGYMNQPHYKEYLKRLYENELSKRGLKKT